MDKYLKKINILHIISEAVGKDTAKGVCGPEIRLQMLSRMINRDRFKITVLCAHQSSLLNEYEAAGADIVTYEPVRDYNILCLMKLGKTIYDLIKSHNIHILHTHQYKLDFICRLVARIANIVAFVDRPSAISDCIHHSPLKREVFMLLDTLAARYTYKIIVPSLNGKFNLIRKQHINPDKIVIIRNGVDLTKFNGTVDARIVRKEFNIGIQNRVVGMIAQMTLFKGHHILIDAARVILKKQRDVKFLLIGDGPLRDELITKVQRDGLESNILFAGFRRDIPECIAACDISVLPSLREGFPLVLLESLAMGKAVIATDVGGVSELVRNGETGWLIPPNNLDALICAIEEALDKPQLAHKLALAGQRFVREKFDFRNNVRAHEKLYVQAVQGR